MKKKSPKSLALKVTEKLDRLTNLSSGETAPVFSIEAQKRLEKALQSYLDATAHLEGAKKEHEIARGHHQVAEQELRSAYKPVKKAVKKQAAVAKKAKKKKKAKAA